MATTKLKTKDPLAFLNDYSVDDLKQAITEVVAELAGEYETLRQMTKHDRILNAADKETIALIRQRIKHWENTQDNLWMWYRKRSEQAATEESANQGTSPVD